MRSAYPEPKALPSIESNPNPMNYKLLFPTYRTRYRFVQECLHGPLPGGKFARGLNLGSGEGDYDPMIAERCQHLTSCDINAGDVAFAKQTNAGVDNLEYQVMGALDLDFPDGKFDLVVSVDVLEHVEDPQRMMQEVGRVLAPGGVAIMTFPQTKFPITYDPINGMLGRKVVSLGAYAFGHETLIDCAVFEDWAHGVGLETVTRRNLSSYLVGLCEMYWPGILQSLFKSNSDNISEGESGQSSLRPSTKEPKLVFLTDALIGLDRAVFGKRSHAVGAGFVLRKGL
ncbi:MAG: class I SAM-dependent methyltransferase [Planctomycetota bacterium]|nr:class I SAM-dependent methyltransferase [Planctomycetota bacterium]